MVQDTSNSSGRLRAESSMCPKGFPVLFNAQRVRCQTSTFDLHVHRELAFSQSVGWARGANMIHASCAFLPNEVWDVNTDQVHCNCVNIQTPKKKRSDG